MRVEVLALFALLSAHRVDSQVIFDDEPQLSTPSRQFQFQQPGFQGPPQQSFQGQNNGFRNPNNGFGNPNNGFGNPNNGFGNPNNGFQNPNNGFQNPNSGFGNSGFQQNNFQNQQGSFGQSKPNNFQNQQALQNQNAVDSQPPDCQTYQNTGGYCTPLPACGRIARIIQNRPPLTAARILRRSICGFSGVLPNVCCPSGRNQQQNLSNNNNNFGIGGGLNNNNDNTTPPGGGGNNGQGQGGIVTIPQTTITLTSTSSPIQIVTNPVKKPVENSGGGLIIGNGPIALLPPQKGGGGNESNSGTLGFSEEGLSDCGFSDAKHTRIVGGKVAEKGAWPWIAALGYKDQAGNVNYLCGGALISPNYVVTASHCLYGRNDLASVRLGDHDLYSTSDGATPIEVEVDKSLLHPQYDPNTFKNDIALLHLKRPVSFSRNIQPICLPSTPELRNQRFENTSPFVAGIEIPCEQKGWGAIQFNGPSSSALREVQIPTVPDSVCHEKYASFKTATVDDTNICAGRQTGGQDACQGDSGGPLMQPIGPQGVRYVLIGVVSFGFKCAEPDFPGVYTRVTSHLDWIQETTKQ